MPRTDALEFEQLESELARALAWQPSPEIVERIDRRVRGVTPSRSAARRWRHPAILLAAAFLLMGAATAALTLVQQAAQYMPGHVVAYDRGERLGLAQRVGDYTITLDRAYGDPNQLVLAFSVAGPRGASPALVRANVVDSSGRSFLEFAGGDATDPETAGSGSILAFDVPPGVAGSVDLTATVTTFMPTATHPPLDPSPPLVYRFSLPFHDATTVTPKLTEAVDGRAITLDWLRVSATATRFRIDTDLTGLKSADHPAWFLEATIRHDRGPEESLTWAAMPPGWTGQAKAEMGALLDAIDGSVVVYQAMSGTDDPSGTWTISVRRLIGVGGTGGSGQAIVDGPWVFTVNVP
jgi:hypothetical protein